MHENSAGKISNVVKYCIWYTMNVRLVAFRAVTLNVFGVNVLNVKLKKIYNLLKNRLPYVCITLF